MQSHLRLVYVIVVVVVVVVLVIVVVVGVIVIVAHLVVVRAMEGHLHVVQQRGMIRRGLCGHACAFIHSSEGVPWGPRHGIQTTRVVYGFRQRTSERKRDDVAMILLHPQIHACSIPSRQAHCGGRETICSS